MTDTLDTPVPDHVERGGLIWSLIERGNGTWGLQQGLGHQGELVSEFDEKTSTTMWRVVTKAIPYTAPDLGFTTWSAAVDHFLTTAGADAIDEDLGDTDTVATEPVDTVAIDEVDANS